MECAVQRGVWFLLHDSTSMDVIIRHVHTFAAVVLKKTLGTDEDIDGVADDLEIKNDKRVNATCSQLHNILLSGDMWQKQYMVLFCMWQYPGLRASIAANSSKNVAQFLQSTFLVSMGKCVYGTSTASTQKGVKTKILAHALSPLETVCYVIKELQLAHYHVVY